MDTEKPCEGLSYADIIGSRRKLAHGGTDYRDTWDVVLKILPPTKTQPASPDSTSDESWAATLSCWTKEQTIPALEDAGALHLFDSARRNSKIKQGPEEQKPGEQKPEQEMLKLNIEE